MESHPEVCRARGPAAGSAARLWRREGERRPCRGMPDPTNGTIGSVEQLTTGLLLGTGETLADRPAMQLPPWIMPLQISARLARPTASQFAPRI
jgi:hypothetical protein